MFMVLGMKTFLWLEALARKEVKPRGVWRSTLMNTGLHVCAELTSTLNNDPSGISPEVSLKWEDQSSLALLAISPLVMLETLEPFL